jgi:hypothetical protein
MKPVGDPKVLLCELERMKVLYAHTLKQSHNSLFIKDLRIRIKLISRRISTLEQENTSGAK